MGVGYTCPDETLLQWNPVPGAARYQVYQLGATNLVPFALTTETVLRLTPGQMQQRYYAVAPMLQGQLLEAGHTIDFSTQGTACYFRSFRARQLVSDTVRFDVELGSVYRLQSATLERLGTQGYEAVARIAPVLDVNMTFADVPPAANRYLYRVRLETTAGTVVYSQPEAAYLVRPGNVLAFPNPVVAGEVLTLIGSNGAVLSVRLYDLLGRVVRETSSDGTTTELSTRDLRKGVYLLRVRTGTLPEQAMRVVVLD
jgi:hypothetical protein